MMTQGMGKKLKCWEYFECNKKECPVYKLKEHRCWLIQGTHCHDEIQGKFLEKIEMCLKCEPFKANMDFDSMEETLNVVKKQFKNFKRMIEERTEDLVISNETLKKEIAERNQAEAALRQSERKYRDIFENVSDCRRLFLLLRCYCVVPADFSPYSV